jgi:CheY-like chemotaxis protein
MLKVLIADARRPHRVAVESSLEAAGFEIEHVADGAAALARLERVPFDLMFLDLDLPPRDGAAVLADMKTRRVKCKVVLMTASTDLKRVREALRQGAAGYLAMPFTRDDVRRVTTTMFRLDPASLDAVHPEVLLVHRDEDAAFALKALLPDHVHLTSVDSIAAAYDRAEAVRYDVILLDHRILGDATAAVAGVIRASQRTAGIFTLTADATAAARRQRVGAVDGTLPLTLGRAELDDFLGPIYLRPLVFWDGNAIFASSFRGDPADLDAYVTQVARELPVLTLAEARTQGEARIDLTRMPQDPARVAQVIRDVEEALAHSGLSVAYATGPELYAQIADAFEGSRTLLFPIF